MSDWYRLPGKTGLSLVMIIAMANYPRKLTAGQMMELSVSSFGTVSISVLRFDREFIIVSGSLRECNFFLDYENFCGISQYATNYGRMRILRTVNLFFNNKDFHEKRAFCE